MKKLVRTSRIALVLLVMVLIMAIYTVRLYQLQIVEGETYLETAVNTNIKTEKVMAARGDILDRYGRVLVSSKTVYNVVFSEKPTPETVIKLVELAGKNGVAYSDPLPVSTETPFAYSRMEETQKNRLSEFINYCGFDKDISADELIDALRERYGLDKGLSYKNIRIIVGVLYGYELPFVENIDSYVFANDVNIDFISEFSEIKVPEAKISQSSQREYHTNYAAHILGRIGRMNQSEYEKYSQLGYAYDAVIGKEGIEAEFETVLHGKEGQRTTISTASGAVTDEFYTVEPEPGSNVVLTLDIGLQGSAEEALKETVGKINETREEDAKSPGGAIVVVDVNSCEILASASYPSFNLATFSEDYNKLATDPNLPLFNRALQGTYSPGSTFKMVTAIAALQEKIIDLSTRIYDYGVFSEYSGFNIHCWIYPGSHGLIDVVEAIKVSCNYFFYTVGNKLGIDLLSKYAADFGLAQHTGVELYEETGILATRSYKEENKKVQWYVGDTLQAAIGQSYNLFTPIQMAVYTATLANGGTRYAAHFLKSIQSADYSLTESITEKEVLSTVQADAEYFEAARKGMLEVAQEGTAASVFGDYQVKVAAKTGTVQLGDDEENNAVFICFAPYDDPEIAVSVVVQKGGSGSAIAQAAKRVLDYYFSEKESGVQVENELIK